MRRERGSTMLELITVLAVIGIFAAVAVPGASRARAAVAGAGGAQRLALVLRAAQAEAQSSSSRVRVAIEPDGDFTVTGDDGSTAMSGRLGTAVTSTYPGNALEFTERGWACAPGSSSPRAGHFTVAGAARSHTVIVQLSGCVRCG